jgi:ABC-type uncharacterized transport system ATPase subunit
MSTETSEEGHRAEGGSLFPCEPADASLGGPSVSIKKLSKTFNGNFKAVQNLSFDMFEGQIFSLLGHNGAGKVRFCRAVFLQ